MHQAKFCLLALLAAGLLFAPSARAADAPPDVDSHTRTAARTLASEGTQAFERKDYAQALDLFRRAGSLVPAPTIALMEARTLVELGRWVEAIDAYASVQKMREDPDNPAFRQAADEAAREAEALMPRIPRLKITVPASETLSVFVDGRVLVPALVGVDNPVDPGAHRVEARREKGAPLVHDVTLAEGERRQLAIELEELAVPAPAPVRPPAPPPPPPLPEQTSRLGVPAIVSFAAGGAGLVLGAVTGGIALGKKSDLDEVCDAELGCPESSSSTLSAYRTHRTLSYVGFGVGIVGVAAGTYFVLSAPAKPTTVAIGVSPLSVVVKGAF
jgi:hypothetical protein